MSKVICLVLACFLWLTGCIPGTYYSTTDDYVIGLRWFDRGNYQNAKQYWKPMAEKGDVDAQFRYGWMIFLGHLGSEREFEGLQWIQRSADQGQAKALILLGDLYHQSSQNGMFMVAHPENLPFDKNTYKALVYYKKGLKVVRYKDEIPYLKMKIDMIEKKLSDAEREKSDFEVDNWQPEYIVKPPRKLL
ncbi:MAG: hypothetical protein ABIH18_00210 [Candidatus Omnitrophota bacterium]